MKYLLFTNFNGGFEPPWQMFAVNSHRRDEDLEILGVPKNAIPDLEFEADSPQEAMTKLNEYLGVEK
jgi:hypothetical protein